MPAPHIWLCQVCRELYAPPLQTALGGLCFLLPTAHCWCEVFQAPFVVPVLLPGAPQSVCLEPDSESVIHCIPVCPSERLSHLERLMLFFPLIF